MRLLLFWCALPALLALATLEGWFAYQRSLKRLAQATVDRSDEGRTIKMPSTADRPADLTFLTEDHPEAGGRSAVPGDREWAFQFMLEDRQVLRIRGGIKSHQDFRAFILRADIDTAADEAMEKL